MGRSHSKSNTKQANLTYYERQLLRKEGAARRIGNDSMKPLDHCNLCLVRVVDGVACPSGHVYCRECAYTDLLAQRAGIEAQRAELAAWEADDERRKAQAREKARERVVADFEKGMGLAAARKAAAARGAGASGSASGSGSGNGSGSASASGSANGAPPGPASGKAIISTEDVDRIAREAEDAAAAAIEAEASAGRKSKLAAFWLPSLAPEAPLGPLKAVKLQTLCHLGGRPHAFSRKGLVPVVFTYPGKETQSEKGTPACPSCARELSNATPAVLLTSRAAVEGEPAKKKAKKEKKDKDTVAVCGHVVCKHCADTLVRPAKQCCVCEARVEEEGMLPLGREGTGFAAAGGAEAKRDVVAFRV